MNVDLHLIDNVIAEMEVYPTMTFKDIMKVPTKYTYC